MQKVLFTLITSNDVFGSLYRLETFYYRLESNIKLPLFPIPVSAFFRYLFCSRFQTRRYHLELQQHAKTRHNELRGPTPGPFLFQLQSIHRPSLHVHFTQPLNPTTILHPFTIPSYTTSSYHCYTPRPVLPNRFRVLHYLPMFPIPCILLPQRLPAKFAGNGTYDFVLLILSRYTGRVFGCHILSEQKRASVNCAGVYEEAEVRLFSEKAEKE